MNIHEYQAKSLLAKYGVAVPRGGVAFSPDEAVTVARQLGGPVWVVKAQIHAGGRGKAGGVKVVKSLDDVADKATGMRSEARRVGKKCGSTVRRQWSPTHYNKNCMDKEEN